METFYLLLFVLFIIVTFQFKHLIHSYINNRGRTVYHENIKTIIVRNECECIHAIKKLLSFSPQIVGFDLEWKSDKESKGKRKASLMQIAFDNRLIILIRLHLMKHFPIELISFLNNVCIIKCGVSIYSDKIKLFNDYKLSMHGVVDLNDIYSNDEVLGLNAFSELLLGQSMKYKKNINHSQWECHSLSAEQINYAANDALIGYRVFMQIFLQKKNKKNKKDFMQFCFGKIDKKTSKLSKKRRIKQRKNKKNKIKINSVKSVECICNNKMSLVLVSECVKNKKSRIQKLSKFIVCNRCHQFLCNPMDKIYECKVGKSIFCEFGYFLCLQCSEKPNDEHYEYRILDKNGDLLHICSLRMFTLFRASKHWVDRLDRFTIKMRVNVDKINVAHNTDSYFRHIAWLNTKCFVCNAHNANDQIFPFKIIPKWFKTNQCALGYRIQFCSVCRSKYNKVQNTFCHKLCEQYLMKTDVEYERLYKMKQIKKCVDCIQYLSKRRITSIETQNQIIQKIHSFYCQYYFDDAIDVELNVNDLMLRECEMNNEIGIDWWRNKNDFKTMNIRRMALMISTNFHRRQYHEYMHKILNDFFKDNALKFAELLRMNLMKEMKPKNYNRKYPAFEILYVEDNDAKFPIGDDEIFDPNDDHLFKNNMK